MFIETLLLFKIKHNPSRLSASRLLPRVSEQLLQGDSGGVKGHPSPISVFQYEDLAHYGLEGVGGGVYGDPHHHHHHHHAARSLQAVHMAAAAAAAAGAGGGGGGGAYPLHQYAQSTHTSSSMGATAGDAVKRDKDAIYGYDEFTLWGGRIEKGSFREVFFFCENGFSLRFESPL